MEARLNNVNRNKIKMLKYLYVLSAYKHTKACYNVIDNIQNDVFRVSNYKALVNKMLGARRNDGSYRRR